MVYMIIDVIKLYPQVISKIYEKHSVSSEEIESVIKNGNPIFKKVGGNQVMAIGLYNRYITLFFIYNQKRKQATITTAYSSDKKQIKYYKKIKG